MKITEDVRKYAAKQGIVAEEALKKGMEAKSKEFVEKGAKVYANVEFPARGSMSRSTFEW